MPTATRSRKSFFVMRSTPRSRKMRSRTPLRCSLVAWSWLTCWGPTLGRVPACPGRSACSAQPSVCCSRCWRSARCVCSRCWRSTVLLLMALASVGARRAAAAHAGGARPVALSAAPAARLAADARRHAARPLGARRSRLAALRARRRFLRGGPLGRCCAWSSGSALPSATWTSVLVLRLREARAHCSAQQNHRRGSCDQLPTHLMHSLLGRLAARCFARSTSR